MAHPKIVFNGKRYGVSRDYYTSTNFSGPKTRLHRDVWEFLHGPIPPGHFIHHRDGNKLNNESSNLQLTRHGKHSSYHAKRSPWTGSSANKKQLRLAYEAGGGKAWHGSPEGRKWHSEHWKKHGAKLRQWIGSGKNIEQLDSIRSLASKWHKSSTGHDWHKKHGSESWARRKMVERVCIECWNKFETYWPNASCCSTRCRNRKNSRKYVESRDCVVCGSPFTCRRANPTRTCSKRCSTQLQVRTKTGL